MKFEIAKEQGINLKEGYNGDLTAKQNGTIGGYMVKKMIEQYSEISKTIINIAERRLQQWIPEIITATSSQ